MAGVTDRPFRQLCRHHGAGLAVSEMLTSDSKLWHTRKSQLRLIDSSEPEPRSVQIAGNDPQAMAHAARFNVERGAQIIDINMGCPAKKVLKKAAGSALLQDEPLVAAIIRAVVDAVDVPVTLKIRTGWSPEQRNGLSIARIAEDNGIAALAVHGRTRACAFKGKAEYDTIAAIKAAIDIPVIANGDIDSPQKAAQVMAYTKADAVMLGRAAQGKPWICKQVDHFLRKGVIVEPPCEQDVKKILMEHLSALYAFYGDTMGVRIARKHVGWYLKEHNNSDSFRSKLNRLETAIAQQQAIEDYFELRLNQKEIAA
jgi:tRNA-dihydrouridine synthase B